MNRRPTPLVRRVPALAVAASVLLLWQHAFAQRDERGVKSPDETGQQDTGIAPSRTLVADSDLFQTTTKAAKTRRPLFKRSTETAEAQPSLLDRSTDPAETGPPASETPPNAADADHPIDEHDILLEARSENAAQARLGEVKPFPTQGAVLQAKARSFPLERRRGGHYRLKMVQGRPMLSPAAVDGMVFVGGGFRSPQVHCLDARTGTTRWTVSLGDNGPTSPAYDDGVVVYNTESCTTYGLDARTGKPLWSAYVGNPLVAMPAIGGGCVLVSHPATRQTAVEAPPFGLGPGSTAGLGPREAARQMRAQAVQWAQKQAKGRGYQLSALELKTGKPRWKRWIDQQVISAPVVYGEDVYVTTLAGTLYKFRLADGEILIARRCRATSAPVIFGDGVFFTHHADRHSSNAAAECIAKVDRMSGAPVYSVHPCRAEYLRLPSQPAGSWPVAFRGGTASTETTTVQGRSIEALQEYSGSRLLAFDGRLFNCMGPEFVCTDPATGERHWSFFLASAGYDDRELAAGPPAVAGGRLFVATLGRQLLQIDPLNGSIEKRFPLGVPVITEPIIDQGRAFLGTRDGQLLCVNLEDEEFTGWSQWGGSAGRGGPTGVHSPGYQLSRKNQ